MTKSELAMKIERQLNSKREAVHLKAGEWQMIIDALRTQTRDAANLTYVLPASASHGSL